jgi:hypothetical protein
MSNRRKRPYAAPTPTNAMRDEVLLDHLINLTDQVGRMAAVLRSHGMPVPLDVGTLGPAPEDVIKRLTEESYRKHFPDRLGMDPRD